MDIDIFPKLEFAFYEGRQRHLDILEYQKQMKLFRDEILKHMPNFMETKKELANSGRTNLDHYISSTQQQQ